MPTAAGKFNLCCPKPSVHSDVWAKCISGVLDLGRNLWLLDWGSHQHQWAINWSSANGSLHASSSTCQRSPVCIGFVHQSSLHTVWRKNKQLWYCYTISYSTYPGLLCTLQICAGFFLCYLIFHIIHHFEICIYLRMINVFLKSN